VCEEGSGLQIGDFASSKLPPGFFVQSRAIRHETELRLIHVLLAPVARGLLPGYTPEYPAPHQSSLLGQSFFWHEESGGFPLHFWGW